MDPDEAAVQRLVNGVVRSVNPLRIVLFGSSVRGQRRPDSDLDILVVMPEGSHRRRTAQRLYRDVSGVGLPFDVVVATPSDLAAHGCDPGMIYRDALAEGREVYAA